MPVSLKQRLDELKGIGPGFDHLRIGLALSIFTWHSFSISYGQSFGDALPRFPVPVLLNMLLPMFFGLSGFLVMGSALRTGELKTFITFRVLRIAPALFTEILISALVLGPLLTEFSLRHYFGDPEFVEYLGSLIGRVRFSLPGLFMDNPAPELVNFALWTVGPEILCYIVMALLMLTGTYRTPRALVAITLLYAAVALAADILFPFRNVGEVLPGKMLIFGFLAGSLVYTFRARLPFSRPIALAAMSAAGALLYAVQLTGAVVLAYAAVPLLVYVVAVVGLTRLPPLPLFDRGDYSYGLYIFGFPVQQAVTHFAAGHREWYVNLALALPITLTCAVCSWHFIERPVLSLRKRIVAREGRPVPARMGIDWRKLGLAAFLCLYGLFIVDAANVLPLRAGGKMVLYGIGLYDYKPTDLRPFTKS